MRVFFLGTVESRHHSLSIFVSCLYHIASHFNKHVAFSGPSTCLFSILRMSFFCVHSLRLTLTHGNTEKAKNKTRRTPLSSRWTTTLTAAMSRIPFPFLAPTSKDCPQPSYPRHFVSLAPPSPHVLPVQSQTSGLAVLYNTHLSATITHFLPRIRIGTIIGGCYRLLFLIHEITMPHTLA